MTVLHLRPQLFALLLALTASVAAPSSVGANAASSDPAKPGTHVQPERDAQVNREFNVLIHFDQTTYSLVHERKALVFRSGTRVHRLVRRPCNQKIFDQVAITFNELRAESHRQTQTKTPYDVEVKDAKGSIQSIARGGEFGTWLRELPTKIMSIETEARLKCLAN